jgi:hypothetical protein
MSTVHTVPMQPTPLVLSYLGVQTVPGPYSNLFADVKSAIILRGSGTLGHANTRAHLEALKLFTTSHFLTMTLQFHILPHCIPSA